MAVTLKTMTDRRDYARVEGLRVDLLDVALDLLDGQ